MSSTLKPSLRQLCEFFSQIAEGKITNRMIQKLIEGPSKSQIFKKNVLEARTEAAKTSDVYSKGNLLSDLVYILAKAGDFEEAREVVTEIVHNYWKANALEIIARFSLKREDIEEAERVKETENNNGGTDLWR